MGVRMMDNRTIRTALEKRVPEVFFVSPPKRVGGKIKWLLIANIPIKRLNKFRPFYLFADMPDTALISHRELLNTMVSEVYDEVKKIKSGRITPEIMPDEKELTPLLEHELESLGLGSFEELIMDKPNLII